MGMVTAPINDTLRCPTIRSRKPAAIATKKGIPLMRPHIIMGISSTFKSGVRRRYFSPPINKADATAIANINAHCSTPPIFSVYILGYQRVLIPKMNPIMENVNWWKDGILIQNPKTAICAGVPNPGITILNHPAIIPNITDTHENGCLPSFIVVGRLWIK